MGRRVRWVGEVDAVGGLAAPPRVVLYRHAGLRSLILLRHREELGARERAQPGLGDRCNATQCCGGALCAANLLEVRVADEDAHKERRLPSGKDETLVESLRFQC